LLVGHSGWKKAFELDMSSRLERYLKRKMGSVLSQIEVLNLEHRTLVNQLAVHLVDLTSSWGVMTGLRLVQMMAWY